VQSEKVNSYNPKPDILTAGPIKLEFHISKTANLFHMVDQISQWVYFCHKQYQDYFSPLSLEDKQILKKHSEVRKKYGWGGGLEKTFYTDLDLDTALERAVQSKVLDQDSAEIEKQVLRHFESRATALFELELPRIKAFRNDLNSRVHELEVFGSRVARFSGTTQITIPVYLIANPSEYNSGGGFNGGRLTLEVPRISDAWPLVIHEITHAFLEPKKPLLKETVKQAIDLDTETLSEGLVYSVPSLFEEPACFELKEQVAKDFKEEKLFTDPYVRFNRFGLALRPLLKEAWDNGLTLEQILPRALDVWRAIKEISPNY